MALASARFVISACILVSGMALGGAWAEMQPTERGFWTTTSWGWAQVECWSEHVLRVQAGPEGTGPRAPGLAVVGKPAQGPKVQLTESAHTAGASSGKLAASLDSASGKLEVLWEGGQQELQLRVGEGGDATVALPAEAEEAFFGVGLQFKSLNHRGKRLQVYTHGGPEADGRTHFVAPMYISSAGYLLFANSPGYTEFDFAAADTSLVQIQLKEQVVDFFLLVGEEPRQLVAEYARLTGKPALPARWGLGFWYRTKSGWAEDEVKAKLLKYRELGYPCDVLGLEPSWQTHTYPCTYVWNRNDFPDPAEFIGWLDEHGFRLNLWEHAWVHNEAPFAEAIRPYSADKPAMGGLVPDFRLPEARELFASYHDSELVAQGVEGFKFDECDGGDWFFPDDTTFPTGDKGYERRNTYGFEYQQLVTDLYKARDLRTYCLVRANFAGGQRFPTCIYSDHYDFRDYVRALANSGFGDILWCPEVRESGNPEHFARRLEVAFFSPLAMINSWASGEAPWEYGPLADEVFKRYGQLRMRLIPYLYSCFYQAHQSGEPVFRALWLDWPEDEATREVDDEYLVGPALLVAPVFEGTSRQVYLPEGLWRDFWTGKRYEGPVRIEYEAPVDLLPLFVKAGQVLVYGPGGNYVGELADSLREIELTAGAEGNFTLFDDDGESYAYERGQCLVRHMTYRERSGQWRLGINKEQGEWTPAPTRYVVRRYGPMPGQVLVNGVEAAQIEEAGEPVTTPCWTYEPGKRVFDRLLWNSR